MGAVTPFVHTFLGRSSNYTLAPRERKGSLDQFDRHLVQRHVPAVSTYWASRLGLEVGVAMMAVLPADAIFLEVWQ